MQSFVKGLTLLAILSLIACDVSEENTDGYNADLNGAWIVRGELTKSECYPENIGFSFSNSVVLSYIDGDIYADGELESDYTYDSGVLRFESYSTETYFDNTYTDHFEATIVFSDNDYGFGTGTSTETYTSTTFTEVCVETFEYSFTRI